MYLGIDIGSTSVKSVVLDVGRQKGYVLGRRESPGPGREREPHSCRIPAEKYYELVSGLLEEAMGMGYTVEGIIFSTQMHGFVLGDTYVSWQDTSCLKKNPDGISYLDELKEKISREDIRRTGVYLKPSLGLCNLYAILGEGNQGREEEIFTLGSYLIHRLTGRNCCHITNAAPWGLVDLETKDWDPELLRKLSFDRMRFPEIAREDTQVCGSFFCQGKEIKVFPDYGDQQVSVLGCGADCGDVIINAATAAQIIFMGDTEGRRWAPAGEIRPYFENTCYLTVSNMPSGRNLEVIAQFIQETVEYITGETYSNLRILEKMALAGQMGYGKSDGLAADIRFYPLPGWDRGGSITGITGENLHIAQAAYAVYENMADTYWKTIRETTAASQVKGIVFAGGVLWNTPVLCEIIRGKTGKPCRFSGGKDEVFYGLFRIACCLAEPGIALKDTGYGTLRLERGGDL
ncbi:MAG: hypothetical protein HFI68_08450 [Lachnospiraceae bacterium]|nr:hypothetical protein [Lachnospiraceae bacterium]